MQRHAGEASDIAEAAAAEEAVQQPISHRREIKMAITAAMVKELREMTGAGMMDCKKALTEARRRYGCKAVEVLRRERPGESCEKKPSRIAAEGIVTLHR